ncbi:hypothetical protein NDU88_002308 [Pleurodeles waltl]|uniref:Endonuclease/exonuclease/phosphatase domain-containing protein n=1 Tax=Pleurodeles waltl TaxID=8319 RepID=A0AAV7Q8B9_PLEWA|nr:hypothetical protein NDU88_002308 [Pleurodeles waltl]
MPEVESGAVAPCGLWPVRPVLDGRVVVAGPGRGSGDGAPRALGALAVRAVVRRGAHCSRDGARPYTGEKQSKDEGSFKDLFAKTPAKRTAQTELPEAGCRDAVGPGLPEHDGAPWTRGFMEQLFESLRADLPTLKQEITADIKDLKREVLDLGRCVDTVEQAQDARRNNLRGKLRDLQSHICLLQETHLLRQDWKKMRSQWFDQQFHSSDSEQRADVAILLPTNFLGRVTRVQAEIPGRLLLLQFDMQRHHMTITNIYGPNEHYKCFLRDALGRVLETPDEDIVVGGDFNLAPDPQLDRSTQRYGQTGARFPGLAWGGRIDRHLATTPSNRQ